LITDIDHDQIQTLVSKCNTLLSVKQKLLKNPEQIRELYKTRLFPDALSSNEVNMRTLFEWYTNCRQLYQNISSFHNEDSRTIISQLTESFPALFTEEGLNGFIEWMVNPITNDNHLKLSLVPKTKQKNNKKWYIFGSAIAGILLSANLYFQQQNSVQVKNPDLPNMTLKKDGKARS
jgi:hypothetical protein